MSVNSLQFGYPNSFHRPYTPLVHSLIRFYFADTERYKFENDIAKQRFEIVREVLKTIHPRDYFLIEEIVGKKPFRMDIRDSYIEHRIINKIKKWELTPTEADNFYRILCFVNKSIALKCGFISKVNMKEVNNNEI